MVHGLMRLRHDAQVGFWGLPAAGILFPGLVIRNRAGNDHILPRLPVDRGGNLMFGGELAGVKQPQHRSSSGRLAAATSTRPSPVVEPASLVGFRLTRSAARSVLFHRSPPGAAATTATAATRATADPTATG